MLFGYLTSKISLFLPFDWTATDKGFTTVGGKGHSTIEPTEINSVMALSTDLLFLRHALGGEVKKRIIYPREIVSTINCEA